MDTLAAWIDANKDLLNMRLAIYLAVPADRENNYVNTMDWKHRVQRRFQRLRIYPINYLRDLAIMNVRTTHYLNMDMDLWPSCRDFDFF